MRQIVLDTETTGLDCAEHRIIEIGCVELVNRRLTGNNLHVYLNPERAIDEGAEAVHGLTAAFLADKPCFRDIQAELDAYLGDGELIIHNAPFDLGFLDAEFARSNPGCGRLQQRCSVIDTLIEARRLHPGQRNSLEALCRRYTVDDSARELHGALLDAQLLALVYLAMTGGQKAIVFATGEQGQGGVAAASVAAQLERASRRPRIIRASAEEAAAHEAYMQRLGGSAA